MVISLLLDEIQKFVNEKKSGKDLQLLLKISWLS